MTETKKIPLKPVVGNGFNFHCHKGIGCFTRCCADLNLVLTPYDILRMKQRLEISSEAFLAAYTETTLDSHPRFPMVKLKMRADEKKRCPFVTPAGCAIYTDRPGACRLYPLARAATRQGARKDTREKYFLVNEPHCQGFNENRQWSVAEWLENQGVNAYNNMNDQWLEIVTSPRSLGPAKVRRQKLQMFFMASYNLDSFRGFLLNSRFFERFAVEPGLKRRLTADDEVLMQFAFNWLKFSLFGEKTIQIKTG